MPFDVISHGCKAPSGDVSELRLLGALHAYALHRPPHEIVIARDGPAA
jgi:hypothetical protein